MDFKGRHVVHMGDLDVDEINHVLDVADKMRPAAAGEEALNLADGKVLANLFFEPSTRTRLSFEAAMARLGGSTVGFAEPATTSVTKGETLADTVRVAAAYADAVVLRHPHEGAGRLAAEYSSAPVLNAGDGAGQHPTQTLLDLYTIRNELGGIAGNTVALVGDLRYGRTVHSLAHALARFGAKMVFVAPPSLQMPRDALDALDELGADYTTTDDLRGVIGELDVLYVTRIQQERFPDPAEYQRVKGSYRVDVDLLSRAKGSAIVMHPLPRVDEVAPEVDDTAHAKYFEQAAAGVPVRMALLALLMGLVE